MKGKRRRKAPSPEDLRRLSALEDAASARGIQIHYDRMEAAGLRLNSGLCTIKGERHLYIEKRQSVAEKIDFIKQQLEADTSSD